MRAAGTIFQDLPAAPVLSETAWFGDKVTQVDGNSNSNSKKPFVKLNVTKMPLTGTGRARANTALQQIANNDLWLLCYGPGNYFHMPDMNLISWCSGKR